MDAGRRELGASTSQRRFALLMTDGFVAELRHKLVAARHEIAIQMMTFDGDESGQLIADHLVDAARRGVEVRLLIDSFARRFVSDRPVGRAEVRQEFRQTLAMFDRLVAAGVKLRFTHPNGPAWLFSLARNHKKIFAIDDIVYLGGINVSDHNFAWHDFMVRVDDQATAQMVRADFDATFSGRRQELDGRVITNRAVERTFDSLIAGATRRVIVASPYALDRRLVRTMETCRAPQRSVVLAPDNNFRSLQMITPYLQSRLQAGGVDVVAYHRFSHAKFLLADDQLLIGSSNYGRHSFWCNQEIGLVVDDPDFVADFEAALIDGQLRPIDPAGPGRHPVGWAASAVMVWALAAYARLLAGRVPPLDRRSRPWRRR